MRTHCGQPMIGVEYSMLSPEHYDGISEWYCEACGTRIGRWSDFVLTGADIEPRYGRPDKDAVHAD
jgi:hypothetical protein